MWPGISLKERTSRLSSPFSSSKNTVRVERAILDITQQQLADAIGVSRNTINSIESGKYVPSTVLALKIARYFSKPAVFICERGLFFVDL